MSELVAASILVSGRVQGVGFRYFVVDTATRLGLSGWVTNLDDGNVEAFAQGTQDQLDQLVEACRQGPPASRVDSVLSTPQVPSGNYRDFRIR